MTSLLRYEILQDTPPLQVRQGPVLWGPGCGPTDEPCTMSALMSSGQHFVSHPLKATETSPRSTLCLTNLLSNVTPK